MTDNERAVIEAAVEWQHVREMFGKRSGWDVDHALSAAINELHNEHDGKWESSQTPAGGVMEGFVVVPVEPDEAMESAGQYVALACLDQYGGLSSRDVGQVYRAMVSATKEPSDD